MRKVILLFIFSLTLSSAFAQVPQLINYQAVIRDLEGQIIPNQELSLQLSINNSAQTGTAVYIEEHIVTTSMHGLVNIKIGSGSPTLGNFSNINWGNGSYFLELAVDQNTGNNFRVLGSSRLVSVPYSLYAANAANVNNSDTSAVNELQRLALNGDTLSLSNGGQVILPSTSGNQQLSISNDTIFLSSGGFVSLPPDLVNDGDSDPNNEIQSLSISNDTLFLTNGGFAELPSDRVNDADADSTNEIQVLSISNDTLFLSRNNGAPISVVLPPQNINLDNDSTNELDSLNFVGVVGDSLKIVFNSDTISSISIASLSTNYWSKNGRSIYVVSDSVGIGTSAPTKPLDVRGRAVVSDLLSLTSFTGNVGGQIRLHHQFDQFGSSNTAWNIDVYSDSTLRIFHSPTGSSAIKATIDRKIGINMPFSQLPDSTLHVLGGTMTTYFRMTNGAGNGKIMVSDANGSASWQSINTGPFSYLQDNDNDTKIQVEESTDEDIIRFDLGSEEKWVMIDSRLEPRTNGESVFIGIDAGLNDDSTTNRNVFIGHEAGSSNTVGYENVAIGYRALDANTNGYNNVAAGTGALGQNTSGQNNVAIGASSLNSNTVGSDNVAIGPNALNSNTTGNGNVAAGNAALRLNTTGYDNIALGENALEANTVGFRNTAIGFEAMSLNTTGDLNTAMGYLSMRSNVDGQSNAAYGQRSLYFNTNGSRNSAVGQYASYANTTGNENAAFGGNALRNNTTGEHNTALGYLAFFSGATFSNSTSIGYNSNITASNQVRIGNTAVSSIGGQVGWTTLSDSRYKDNVNADVIGLDFILKLNPVTYNLNTQKIYESLEKNELDSDTDFDCDSRLEKAQIIQSGFLAQEVEQAAKESGYNFSGVDAPKNENDIYGLRYAEFVVPLVKAIQEQQEVIEALQKRLDDLEAKQ